MQFGYDCTSNKEVDLYAVHDVDEPSTSISTGNEQAFADCFQL